MKNKLIILIMLIITITIISGCGNKRAKLGVDEGIFEIESEQMIINDMSDGADILYVIKDKETGKEYILLKGYTDSIIPR